MSSRGQPHFESKRYDYAGEDGFFSDEVRELAAYDWVGDDLAHWVEGYPSSLQEKRILEIGGSEGVYGAYVAERLSPAVFVSSDIIYRRLIGAREKARELGGRLQIEAASSYRLPHPASSFDVVICNGALCHMPGLAAVVDEIARVLRPGGTYFGSEPNFHNPLVRKKTLYGPWASPNMVPVYPEDLKREFGRAGFSVEVSLFWRRFPWIRGKYFAVSQKITARL